MASKTILMAAALYMIVVCMAAAFTAYHWPAITSSWRAWRGVEEAETGLESPVLLSTEVPATTLRVLEAGHPQHPDRPARDWALPTVHFRWAPALEVPDMRATLLWKDPALVSLENILTADECGALIALAAPHMGPSLTITHDTGKHIQDPSRTSYTALMRHDAHPFVWTVMERAARVMGTLPQFLETLQVVRYLPGQKFDYHHDFLNAGAVVDAAGQRSKTLFVYLTERGSEALGAGTTRFNRLGTPAAQHVIPSADAATDGVVDTWCPQGGGLLWCNTLPDGVRDWRTLHTGTAPTVGVKWGLNVWGRTKRNARITDQFLHDQGYVTA